MANEDRIWDCCCCCCGLQICYEINFFSIFIILRNFTFFLHNYINCSTRYNYFNLFFRLQFCSHFIKKLNEKIMDHMRTVEEDKAFVSENLFNLIGF